MHILEVFSNAVTRKIRLNINGQEDVTHVGEVGRGSGDVYEKWHDIVTRRDLINIYESLAMCVRVYLLHENVRMQWFSKYTTQRYVSKKIQLSTHPHSKYSVSF